MGREARVNRGRPKGKVLSNPLSARCIQDDATVVNFSDRMYYRNTETGVFKKVPEQSRQEIIKNLAKKEEKENGTLSNSVK